MKEFVSVVLALLSTISASHSGEGDDHGEMDGLLAEAVALLPEESVTARPPESLETNAADRGTIGEWSEVISWPHIPVTAANLPDGRIITWAASRRTAYPGGDPEFTYAAVYSPSSHQITEINHEEHNMFCGHPAMLASGYAVVAGGRKPSNKTSYFDYMTNQWVNVEAMNDTRWYPASTALPDGSMITASGNKGAGINTVERYMPGEGWHRLSNIDWSSVRTKPFPFNFVAPDGRIISAGPQGPMFWLDFDADNGAGKLISTSVEFPGNRIHQSGGIAMIDEGKIIFAGGGVATGGTTAIAHLLDLTDSNPKVTEIASMHHRRRFHNALVLPNGDLIVIGGNTSAVIFSDSGTVYEPEVWNRDSDTWTIQAPAAVPRNYHSVALMLPDGRIFSGGGGLSGNAATNHQNAQFFSPSYLFNPDGSAATRPEISSAPDAAGTGQTIEATASHDVSRFTMLRMTATTHAFSSDVRFLEVPFGRISNSRYELTLHSNPNVLLPGFWMLFALNENGVPSEAKVLKIHIPSIPTLASPGNQQSLVNESVNLQLVASDTDGDPLTFSASNLPAGLSIDPLSGIISGIPQRIEQVESVLQVTDHTNTTTKTILWQVTRPIEANISPEITHPGPQISAPGRPAEVTILATDPNGDPIHYSATGLPTGTAIHSENGVIHGVPTVPGEYSVTVTVSDLIEENNITFPWIVRPILSATPLVSGPLPAGITHLFRVSVPGENIVYSWNFGDGSPIVQSSIGTVSHQFLHPGRYTITINVRDDANQTAQVSFHQAIYSTPTSEKPAISQSIIYEPRNDANDRVWNVNPDNDTVTVIDAVSRQLVATINVGDSPRSLALTDEGEIWVTNKSSASVTIINTSSLTPTAALQLKKGSSPHGIVISPTENVALIAMEDSGKIAKFSTFTREFLSDTKIGSTPRHLSIDAAGERALISLFITPPVNGEATLNPSPAPSDGGKVVVVNVAEMLVESHVTLGLSNESDGATKGRGVPNYLGPPAISPDGMTVVVSSKQDNIQRGSGRDGQPLNFEHTVRSITSSINLNTLTETPALRTHHDNAGIAVTSLFGQWGNYAFVALEGSRAVAIIDAYSGTQVARFETGRAPQGLALSPDGRTLFVHNFMDRSVTIHDLTQVINGTGDNILTLSQIPTSLNDALPESILRGKQLFYDSLDQRLALEEYISCASCHSDGGHDGRVWDLTGFGEGLRNTIDLRGRGGLAHGALHWSANFDEVQDFEGQIRDMSAGAGLIENSPHPPLGQTNSGRSSDLDALAAYVTSLDSFAYSPHRSDDGSLSASAIAGREIFRSQNCASCHSGEHFTDSPGGKSHDIGTIKGSSGSRLSQLLEKIDTPTLRGLWHGAPFLHDGSAATLEEAIAAHNNITLNPSEMIQLIEYLKQIDQLEPSPGGGDEEVIAHYHFDGSFSDSSSNSLTLTPSGNIQRVAASNDSMQPSSGHIARFSAVGDTLSVSIPDSLIAPENGSPFTLEARIYLRRYLGWSVENVPVLFLRQEWDTQIGLIDRKWGTPKGAHIRANKEELLSVSDTSAVLTPDQWHHLQFSFDGQSTVRVFVDGNLISSVEAPPHPSRTNPWVLTLGNFDGDIDEVLLKRTAITANESEYPSTWETWVNSPWNHAQASTTSFDSNPDGDFHVDLMEYALGTSPISGISSSQFSLRRTGPDDNVLATFRRPSSVSDIEYQMETSTDRQHWHAIDVDGNSSITDNADGTETVIINDVHQLTGADAIGFARLTVTLTGTAIKAHSPDFAWMKIPLQSGYQTIGINVLHPPLLAGIATSIDGSGFGVGSANDILQLMETDKPYFVEFQDGTAEGHRFDVDLSMTAGNRIALDLSSPNNTTSTFAAPTTGQRFALHAHHTIDDVFEKDSFIGSTNPSDSDQLYFYSSENSSYESYFFLDAGIDSPFHQWTSLTNAELKDLGSLPISPGVGVFLQRPENSAPATLTLVGMVRQNLFRNPLQSGYNLVAGGYPLPQSPTQRQAILSTGFSGGLNPSESDQIQFWLNDQHPTDLGYAGYFLLNAGADSPYRYWTSLNGAELLNVDDVLLFEPGRAAFLLIRNGPLPDYRYGAESD